MTSPRHPRAFLLACAVTAVGLAAAGAPRASAVTTRTTNPASTAATVPVANPYAGAEQYLNVDWSAQVRQFAEPISSAMHVALMDAADQPTAVWLEANADVAALEHHLDAAVTQSAAHGRPVVVTIVVDNRPGRDCWDTGYVLNEDPGPGLADYQKSFLDPLAALLSQPRYVGLRFAAVIEPGGLLQLVTSQYGAPVECSATALSGRTVPAIQQALDTLGTVPNASLYLDGGGAARTAWDAVLPGFVQLTGQVVQRTKRQKAGITGFAVDVADYTPWREPFFTAQTTITGLPARSSTFLDWTMAADEQAYVGMLREALTAQQWPSSIGVVLDTSRNGWGGPARPTALTPSSDVNAFVDANRLDRRLSRQNWCNQSGAGMGARPAAAPVEGIQAFVWIANPGISDGRGAVVAGEPGSRIECDPSGITWTNSYHPTGALPDAPAAGEFFPAFLVQLAANSWPPLHGLDTTTSSTSTTKSTTTTTRKSTKTTTKKPTKTKRCRTATSGKGRTCTTTQPPRTTTRTR